MRGLQVVLASLLASCVLGPTTGCRSFKSDCGCQKNDVVADAKPDTPEQKKATVRSNSKNEQEEYNPLAERNADAPQDEDRGSEKWDSLISPVAAHNNKQSQNKPNDNKPADTKTENAPMLPAPKAANDAPGDPRNLPMNSPGRPAPLATNAPATNAPAVNTRFAPARNAANILQGSPPGPIPPGIADPHERPAPTAYGSVLNLPPGKSPVEKALELTAKVEHLAADNAAIKERIRTLEDTLQARDRLLNQATQNLQDATGEVARVRRDLADWAKELEHQQGRLRQQDLDHQETLRAVIRMLEKAVGPEDTTPSKRD